MTHHSHYLIARWLSVRMLGVVLNISAMRSWASSGPGTESASFLDIPIGAAPAALGSAYTSRAKDAYAPVWNPAGLGFTNAVHVSATHLLYLKSIHYEYLGAAVPLGHGIGLGASAQYLGSGDITAANEAGDITGSFTSNFGAYSLAYGQALTEKLSMGVSGKLIREKIADVTAKAYAADAGIMYNVSDQVVLAGAIANMGNSVKFINEKDPLPLAYRMGAWVQIYPTLDVSAEMVSRKNGLFSGSGGMQWEWEKIMMFRAGVNSAHTKGLTAMSAFTAGLGIRLFSQELAYAWVPYSDLGSTHYFSLDFRFGGSPEVSKRGVLKVDDDSPLEVKDHKVGHGSDEYQMLESVLSGSERKALERPGSPPTSKDTHE